MFDFDLTDELKIIIKKLIKKYKKKVEIINKKIREIVNSDEVSIQHYKNLRNDLKDFKRVHIGKSFVLVFKVDIKNKFILFADFDHHDKIYKKKLISPKQLEGIIGKKHEIMRTCVKKPPGKPKLVPGDDKRKPMDAALIEQFADLGAEKEDDEDE